MTDSERATMITYGNFCPNSNALEVIRHFLFARDFPTGSEILGVFGEKDPHTVKISKNTCLKGISLSQSASFEICTRGGHY